MATPDTRDSLVIVKQFTYRGTTKTWTNRYHLNTAIGSDLTKWSALATQVIAQEKACYTSAVTIVQALGYDSSTATSTNPHGDAVYTEDFSVAGTGTFTNFQEAPGDAAALVRYATDQRTSKNHPVYLFNYYHGVGINTAASADAVNGGQKTNLEEYALAWVNGITASSITYKRCGPRGAVAQSRVVNQYITHRDFPS